MRAYSIKEMAIGFLVSAITLVALFAISEGAIRLYTRWSIIYDIEMSRYATEIKNESPNPLIGHVHRPSSEATLMGVRVDINADGFRDREYPVERNGNSRIVFLGDSLTFGWGVEKSKTFEEILEAELSTTKPTEIINLGAGNYNTEQEVNLFAEKGLKYKPDEVVVFYFINDAEPTPHKSQWEFLGQFRVVTFFWSRLKSLIANTGPHQTFRDYYAGLYADTQPGWTAAKKAFIELKEICASKNIALRVVLLPELHMLQDYPFAAEHRKILEFLRDNGIAALDLAPFFKGEKDPMRLWVASDDAHPNAIAHAMIARFARDFIVEGADGRKAASKN
jgi:lysophospholipase L1-like esterase